MSKELDEVKKLYCENLSEARDLKETLKTRKLSEFDKILTICQTADLLLFYNTKNLISKGIAEFKTLDYKNNQYIKTYNIKTSHVAIYLGGGKNLILESSFPKGTQLSTIQKYFKKDYIIEVKRLIGITVNEMANIKNICYEYIATHPNQKYDWISFLGLLYQKWFNAENSKNIFANNQKQFCSSLADDIWKLNGRDFFPDLKDKQVTPNDWACLKEFETKIKV
jgi:hypothetical protein